MGKTGKMFKIIASGFKSPSKENHSKEKTSPLSSKKTDRESSKKGSKDRCIWSLGKSSSRSRDIEATAMSPPDVVEIKTIQSQSCKNAVAAQGFPPASDYEVKGPLDANKPDADIAKGLKDLSVKECIKESSKEDWAATKIQATFRCFSAQRAFRALKALVRVQALVRGWMVRKKAAASLRFIQALVRLQAVARGRRVRSSELGQLVQKHLQQAKQHHQKKKSAEGWVNSISTAQQLQAKAQSKQDAIMKRQRALVYAFSEQLNRPTAKTSTSAAVDCHIDKKSWIWVWLERWDSVHQWSSPLGPAREQWGSGIAKTDKAKARNEGLVESQKEHKAYTSQAADGLSTMAAAMKTEKLKSKKELNAQKQDEIHTTQTLPHEHRDELEMNGVGMREEDEKLVEELEKQCSLMLMNKNLSSSSSIAASIQPASAVPTTSNNFSPMQPTTPITSSIVPEANTRVLEERQCESPLVVSSPTFSLSSPLQHLGTQAGADDLLPLHLAEEKIPDQRQKEASSTTNKGDCASDKVELAANIDVDEERDGVQEREDDDKPVLEEDEALVEEKGLVKCDGEVLLGTKPTMDDDEGDLIKRGSVCPAPVEASPVSSPSLPNYMTTTKSAKAKVRPHTSPKLAKEPPKQKFDSSPKPKKKVPTAAAESPNSLTKRRDSLSSVEGKNSPGALRSITHVRASSKGGHLGSGRELNADHSPANGDSRRHDK